MLKTLLATLCIVLSLNTAWASEINESAAAADPVAEKRLQALAAELRCLVCQNQTIADSNAELAIDLRREVRSMIQAGQSDAQIIDFMVNRYGDFVLYRPPVKGLTLLLWGGPITLLLLGVFGLIRHLRQRNQTLSAQSPLSAEALNRADALLKQKL
jgi:cytochrome c-type biogenesis protein CcmH